MTYIAPNHYSYNFKFDIEKLPAMQKDKIPSRLSVLGIIFGLFFVALGGLELANYFLGWIEQSYDFSLPNQMSVKDMLYKRLGFDALVLLMGLFMIGLAIMSLLRYKKIFFDGENIKIVYRQLNGKKYEETEALYNYLGVLLKVEYYQLGLINRNRYIIELYHKDTNKRVPLYISTNDKDLREIWEYYAAKLKMPALFMTDHGLISRNHNELTKTLRDMSKKWKLNSLYHNDEDMPSSVKYSIKNNKVVVKEKRLFFDVYSILSFLGIIILGSLLVYAIWNYKLILQYINVWSLAGGITLCLAIILFSVLVIFSKDVLIITQNDIILGHNIGFIRIDAEFLPKNKIEAVDIGHNPTTNRYYLSVITHDRNMIFGKNMPIDDLRWVRGFIIREVVK